MPYGWVNYTVQSGDTLSLLARATFTSINLIQEQNCNASDTLYAGQNLYLPFNPSQANNLMNPIPSRLTFSVQNSSACYAFDYPDPWEITTATPSTEIYNYTVQAGRGGLERYQFKMIVMPMTATEYEQGIASLQSADDVNNLRDATIGNLSGVRAEVTGGFGGPYEQFYGQMGDQYFSILGLNTGTVSYEAFIATLRRANGC